mmetsp:Transcript_32754/g.73936  ORF Transcript_32754/g.73936 Transcript_32754/m.73936 type:complete len:206 (-) Transcript_32754:1051-1668(-)
MWLQPPFLVTATPQLGHRLVFLASLLLVKKSARPRGGGQGLAPWPSPPHSTQKWRPGQVGQATSFPRPRSSGPTTPTTRWQPGQKTRLPLWRATRLDLSNSFSSAWSASNGPSSRRASDTPKSPRHSPRPPPRGMKQGTAVVDSRRAPWPEARKGVCKLRGRKHTPLPRCLYASARCTLRFLVVAVVVVLLLFSFGCARAPRIWS